MSTHGYTDEMLAAFDRLDHLEHDGHFRSLKKLNKAELRVLAKHYGIKEVEVYFDDWKHGGKDELCHDLADYMMNGEAQ